MKKELDEMLVRYLQLCEAFRDSDIWSDEARKSMLHYLIDKDEIEPPVMDLFYPLNRACKILKELNNGDCIVSDKYEEIHKIADGVWYALEQRSYIRDNTSEKEINVDKAIVEDLVRVFGRGETKVNNKYLLQYISGEVWDALGGDI